MIKTMLLSAAFCAATVCPAQLPQLGKASIDDVIGAMTLQEKIDLIVGINGSQSTTDKATVGQGSTFLPGAAGQTNAIPRLGIPALVYADGPAGLRINPTRPGTDKTFYCTHFPVETVMSATWNTDLVQQVGTAMGDEVLRYGADVLLAPATNIHRNPLNGRNFEYYSEDPLLAGKICAAMVRGIQSNGVGTSLKHFALNNQETNRTSNNVIGSPRTFREIYLRSFEIVVRESQPWTVMTSYNKINGTFASERSDLVTDILRHEWGFSGMVMTDWYGGQHPELQMLAGNDQLMPGKLSQREVLERAVKAGTLPMEIIDRNVKHILQLVMLTPRFKGYVATNDPDLEAHARVTRQAASEGMVLLRNEKGTLPLGRKVRRVAAFGFSSYDFIAGGTGSGDVHHAYVVSLIDGLKASGLTVDPTVQQAYTDYIPTAKAATSQPGGRFGAFLPRNLIAEMDMSGLNLEALARTNDVALITIGKTSGEFTDRKLKGGFTLTDREQKMISEVSGAFHKAGKRVVVVLNVCGPVETESWIGKADAVLVAWLPGQEGGNSVADILTGVKNPSGRLPMTWPKSYADVPSRDDFPVTDGVTDEQLVEQLSGFMDARSEGKTRNVDYTEYNEGIYVGYRYYDTRHVAVSYPFGYGLSYTTFRYGRPVVERQADGSISVSVEVKNAGRRSGKEVVQVYVAAPGKDMPKPSCELKAFAKTRELQPGEAQTLQLTIPYASLASFNEAGSQWQVEGGSYTVMVARHAADARPLTAVVNEEAKVTECTHEALTQ